MEPRWHCIDKPSIPAAFLIPNVLHALLTLCSHAIASMASFARIVSYAACLLFRLFLALSFEVVCGQCYGIAGPRTRITVAGPQTSWIDLDYVASAEWPGKRPIAFRRTSSDNTQAMALRIRNPRKLTCNFINGTMLLYICPDSVELRGS